MPLKLKTDFSCVFRLIANDVLNDSYFQKFIGFRLFWSLAIGKFMMRTLILAFIALLHGQSIAQSEGWTYGQSSDGKSHWAGTLNDSGGAFMQRCTPSEGSCVWLIALPTVCEDTATFPMLASSDEGAANILVLCGGSVISDGKTVYQYFFKDFDQINNMVRRTASPIGFAMSLKSGQFRVVRFDMTNAVKAIDSMRLLAEMASSKNKKKTKDQIL